MANMVTLLQLSPTMSEGTIVKWNVQEGDEVSTGDVIAEVETDKAVMEQESFEDGKILKILAAQGDSVPVGANIAIIGEEGEDISGLEDKAGNEEEQKQAPAKEERTAGEMIAAAKKPRAKEEEKQHQEAPVAESKPAAKERKAPPAPQTSEGRVFVSPLARKMAEEHNLELARIEGSGPNGRIVRRDVEQAIGSGAARQPQAAGIHAGPHPSTLTLAQPSITPATEAADEEIPLTRMRQVIARRLVESRQQIPSFSLHVDVNAQPLLDAVAIMRERLPEQKITITHFVIKAMASMLMKHEWLRTQWAGEKLVRKNAAHVSVAVAIEDGLLTPVIRNAHAKGLSAIASELRELAGRARERKLGEEDLTDGVQTLSNLGMFGIDHFDAIINPPESSILAVGRVIDKPVAVDGKLKPGKVITLTLSCDHRVVDGAVGASYLSDLKGALEYPLMMLV